MHRLRSWARPSFLATLIGSGVMAACESSTAIAMVRDVATSVSITASVGSEPSREQLVLEVGDTVTLSAMATNPLGLAVPAARVTWTSADTSVARIDASGLVSAVGVGTAEIRAAIGEAVSSLPTTVNEGGAL